MKSDLLIGILVFLSAMLSVQSGCNDDYGKNDTEIASGQSLFWRIDHKDLPHPSYLYGTMHIIPEKDFHLGSHLEKIVVSSDQVVFEMKLDLATQLAASKGVMLPDGQTLEDLLSEADFRKLKSFLLDSMGISKFEFMTYTRMKPVMISQVFSMSAMGEQPASFELSFQALANENDIPIAGLETASEQLAFFDSIPMNDQIDMLMNAITGYHEDLDLLDKMVTYYKNQWIDSLLMFLEEDAEDLMAYESILLSGRNKDWIPKLESFIQKGKAFIAVGAAHLPGKGGVIALLRGAGYTLTPVSVD